MQSVPVIPAPSLIAMFVCALVVIVIPLVLLIVLQKKYKAEALPFFVGAAVFILFALVLEGAVNYVLLNVLPVGKTISSNIVLYACIGGLMAGLFEETGRYVAFRTVLRRKNGNDANAFMYGAGHGGIEAILLVGLTYISFAVISILLSSGNGLAASIPAESAEQLDMLLKQYADQPSWMFYLSIVERCIAIIAHICFSVLVWFAAKRRKSFMLYPAAILLHAAYDASLVLLADRLSIGAAAIEGLLALMTVPLVILAVVVWKRQKTVIACETVPE